MVLGLVTVARPVSAQMSDADREEARALFAAGQAAVDAGRWPDALAAFERAYELTDVPSALFNAAFALRALGRFGEAERAFSELLTLEGTRDDMRAEAEGYLAEVRARLASVRLLGLPEPEPELVVRLDALEVPDDGTRPFEVHADPGHHVLDVSRAGYDRFEWTGELTNGETRTLAVDLLPLPGGGGSDVTREAWFWVVIGIVAAGAVAGGVVGGIFADEAAQLQPESMMSVRL